ncbi:MAG: AmmeMemoRadiSam system radical SAM enzyme [Syntrophomonadaceae bacterium]|nr:AmmeMemoRadiSam system radical SAM enzyme [Syntrophomonadaceae bacterium]
MAVRPAEFYIPLENDELRCQLCPRACVIRPGRAGVCRVRENRGGELVTRNYGMVTSYGLDPIEKKPLYHFYPGSLIFSIGTLGCNLHCQFCQNWTIAHGDPRAVELDPGEAVEVAERERENHGNIGIAYTYSEPTVWYEYVLETAELAHRRGLRNILVTNGYIQPEPLKRLLPLIDAMNIDVKGYREEFYRRWCRGGLAPVLRTVETAHQHCHVELTNLVITGLNDTREELSELADWVRGISPDIPLHLSRYFPNYRLDRPPTPLATLEMAYGIARERLNYVYLGNVGDWEGSDTDCPACGQTLIVRRGYRVSITGLKGSRCRNCGERIPVVGLPEE